MFKKRLFFLILIYTTVSLMSCSNSPRHIIGTVLEYGEPSHLIGTVLEYDGGETYYSSIELGKDTFTFKGFKSDNFISRGTWKYSQKNNSIILTFLDNKEYWKKILATQSEGQFRGILMSDPNNCTVELQILSDKELEPDSGEYINFFNWVFVLKKD